jgi:hypothetical protein
MLVIVFGRAPLWGGLARFENFSKRQNEQLFR